MNDNQPELSPPVELINKPRLEGDEVPARKAIEWAKANTGTEKPEIKKQIMKALHN